MPKGNLCLGSFTANQVDEFLGSRQTPGLFLGVDLFSIDENIECARCAGTQPNGDMKFTFDIVLKAHGLCFDVASNEAAFDLDTHVSTIR